MTDEVSTARPPETAGAKAADAGAPAPRGPWGLASTVCALAAFGVCLAYGAYLRFHGVTTQGVGLLDNWQYLHVGNLWAEGERAFIVDAFYRPVPHLLHGWAIRLWGYNDYSIKFLHGGMDLLNLVFIFSIGAYLCRSLWAGLASAAPYVAVPLLVDFARMEMVQVMSAFFLLLAFLMFAVGMAKGRGKTGRYVGLAAAGLSLGLAVNTHMELAIFGPVFVGFIVVGAVARRKEASVIPTAFWGSAALTGAFLIPYVVGMAVLGPSRAVEIIAAELSFGDSAVTQTVSGAPAYEVTLSVLTKSIKYLLGGRMLVAWLFGGALALSVLRLLARAKDPLMAHGPGVFVLAYMGAMGLMFSDFNLVRLFVPIIPFVFLTIVYWSYVSVRSFARPAAAPLVVCGALALAAYDPCMKPGDTTRGRFATTQPREAFDLLHDKVDSEHKLLIAPLISYFGALQGVYPSGFRFPFYFGENAIYPISRDDFPRPYAAASLHRFCRVEHVRYVYVAKNVYLPKAVDLKPDFKVIGDSEPYSVERDLDIVKTFLSSVGATRIEDTYSGSIYELPDLNDPSQPVPVRELREVLSNGQFSVWNGQAPAAWSVRPRGAATPAELGDGERGGIMLTNQPEAHTVVEQGLPLASLSGNDVSIAFRASVECKAPPGAQFSLMIRFTVKGERRTINRKYDAFGEWQTLTAFDDFPAGTDYDSVFLGLGLNRSSTAPAVVRQASFQTFLE